MLSFINRASARHAFAPIQNIALLVGGDSIGNRLADTYSSDFIQELAAVNITATIDDGAQGGQKLEDFVDFTTGGKGSKYINLWDDIAFVPNKATITDLHFTIGTNDVQAFAEGTLNKADYKAAFLDLIDLVFSDFPSLARFYIRPIGRFVNNSSISYPQAVQDIRELQNEIVSERSNVYILPPFYDLPLEDTVHPTPTSARFMAKRDATRIANVLGLQTTPAKGMTITSASVSTLGIDITINHDSGDDLTVPSAGAGLDFFRLDGGTNFTSIDRVDANTFRLYGGAPYTGTPTLQTAFGQMFDLGIATPETVQENGLLTLPLIQEEVTVTNTLDDTDVILQLNNLKYYSRPELFARNTTSGNDFDTLGSVNNTNYELYDAGAVGIDMTYDATAFGGVGGFSPSVNDGFIRGNDDLLDARGGWLAGFVVEFGNTAPDADRTLFALGREAGILSNARLYTRNGINGIYLQRADDLGFPLVQGGMLGNRFAIIINLISGTEGEIYVNDASSPALTFDPRADWLAIGTDTIVMGGNASNIFGMSWVKQGAHDAINDPSLSDIMTYMKGEYNV